MKFAEYLKAEGRKLSWICERTGISVSQLSQYKRGRVEPSPKNARLIYLATGGKVTEFGEWPTDLQAQGKDDAA